MVLESVFMLLFHIWHLKFHGKQVGTQHIRRKPWFRAKDGIAILHGKINRGEVKRPKLRNHCPGSSVKSGIGIWIVFTELSQDTVLIGGMPASIIWFQNVHLQSRANMLLN